jgi:hypothetical protein
MSVNQKNKLIELIRENPIVELACRKANVSRSTFYRWKISDKKFADDIEKARTESKEIVSDLAESQLITSIKNGQMQAVIFWLKSHHKDYATKVELSGQVKMALDELSDEQQANIEKALKLYNLLPQEQENADKTKKE